MSESQELCYQAYVKLGLKDAIFVYRKRGTKECPQCGGAGLLPTIGDTE